MKSRSKNDRKKLSGPGRVLHDTFEIGIILKGVDGLFEILGGLLLYVIGPAQINRILLVLLQHELSEDRRDMVANFLIRLAGHLSMGTQLFGSFCLLSHGVIKAVIVISLWRKGSAPIPRPLFFLWHSSSTSFTVIPTAIRPG